MAVLTASDLHKDIAGRALLRGISFKLERSMAAGAADEALLARYARAQARLEARGGYLWRDRATAMARGLGFGEADLERGLDSFSGGELTRASLARVLATGADLLLL